MGCFFKDYFGDRELASARAQSFPRTILRGCRKRQTQTDQANDRRFHATILRRVPGASAFFHLVFSLCGNEPKDEDGRAAYNALLLLLTFPFAA